MNLFYLVWILSLKLPLQLSIFLFKLLIIVNILVKLLYIIYITNK
nr:MAG TPA: hypothetical protein [Caudoviricetes sp.]